MSEGAMGNHARFERFWNDVYAASPELVFALDGRRRILAVSDGFARRLGPSGADVVGHTCAEVAHGGGVIPGGCPLRDLLLDGEQHDAEVHSDLLGGDFLVRVSPVFDEAGELEFAIHSLVEVTDRRLAEAALRENEARFRGYFEQTLVGVMVASPRRGLVEVNQAACDLLGYDREELLRLTWTDLTHPDDLDADLARNRRLLEGEITNTRFEKRFIRKNGEVVHADMTLICQRAADGSVGDFLALFTDVTERRRLAQELDDERQRFKLLVENSGEAFILSEPDGVIHFANAAACQMFGRSEEDICRLGRDGLVDHTDPHLAAGLRTKKQTGEFVGELRFVRGDGSVFTGEISTNEYTDHEGNARTSTVIRDLTEAKRAEQALRESETKYRMVADLTFDWEWWLAPDGTYVYVSPACARITGHAAEEFLADAHLLLAITHPDDVAMLRDHIEASLIHGSGEDLLRFRIITAAGEERTIEHLCQAAYGQDGTYLGRRGTHRDVTEQRHAEVANARLAAIVESAEDAIISKALDGTIVTWNRGAERIYGYAAEEVIGKPISLLVPPASQDQLATLLEQVRGGVATQLLEAVRLRKDGSPVDVLLSVSPIRDEAGVVVGASTIAHDISERKRAERLLGLPSEILEIIASPHPVRETAEGIVDALKRATGLDAVGLRLQEGEDFPFVAAAGYAEEFLSAENNLVARYPDGGVCHNEDGSVCLECTCGLVVTGAIDTASELFTPGGSCWTNDSLPSRETRPTKDPRLNPRDRCVHDGFRSVALVPLRAGEQILGLLHLADHRSDRFAPESIRFFEGLGASIGVALRHKQAEAEIRQLNVDLEERVMTRTAQLEATNKELEAFAYSVSHDLRAPLRAIDGFSAMVIEDSEGRLDDADLEHLQRVRDAAQRMAMLIDDLLGLSRVGRQDMQLVPVDVSALAEEVLAELRAAEPGRLVECVIAPGLRAQADAVLLRVILVNLLGNAWKFTSRHDTARIEVGEVDGEERAFFVRDDGAGFDARYADHLFGVFQRMHSPEEFEGVGIGLATVQRLVSRHGGRVWAEAELEKGATFFFTLPGAAAAG